MGDKKYSKGANGAGNLDAKLDGLQQSIDTIKSHIEKGITTPAAAPANQDAGDSKKAPAGESKNVDSIIARIQDKIVKLSQGGDSPAVSKHLEAIDSRLDEAEARLSKLEGGGATTAANEEEEEETTN